MVTKMVLKYVELKTGYNDNGPAWITRVKMSRSGQSIYFGRKALKRTHGGGIAGNYWDIETGDEYWVSGVKKRGLNRHWAGSGKVAIEVGAVDEYLQLISASELDCSKFQVVPDLDPPDPERVYALENRKLQR